MAYSWKEVMTMMKVINRYKDNNIEYEEKNNHYISSDRQHNEDEMFLKWTMVMGSMQGKELSTTVCR